METTSPPPRQRKQRDWPKLLALFAILMTLLAAVIVSPAFITGFRFWPDANVPKFEYANCDEAREKQRDPVWRNEPGYHSDLDRDSDGKGCDPKGATGWLKVTLRDAKRLAGGSD